MAAPFQGIRCLMENSYDAISLIDTQGEILYGSAATSKLFGYPPDELVGRNCFELIHPEDRARSTRTLQELIDTSSGPLQFESRFRHKDGQYCWVESTIANLLFEFEVQAIVMQQRNINTRRTAELKSRQQAAELTSSNARLEQFAYQAAHDLREPLRSIAVYAEMLLDKTQMDANGKEMAKTVVDSAVRLSHLVENLLSFASTGRQELPGWVDVGRAAAQAVQNLAQAIKASDAVVTVGRLPIVRSDEINLIRVFQNLIENAVRYSGDQPPEIHVSAEDRGAAWIIRIQDNGPGIKAEDHGRIFMPFMRLEHRDAAGNGLGLAVCKRIIEDLGGTIWVESQPGTGSIFCFTIAANELAPAAFACAVV